MSEAPSSPPSAEALAQAKQLWGHAKLDAQGLVAAVVIDRKGGDLRMVGYMNEEALAATLDRGRVVFFSRSKQRLWEKGETSGNVLSLKEIRIDCDGDALACYVDALGPTCHTGARSCFFRRVDEGRLRFDDGPEPSAPNANGDHRRP
jgi:phosphoribosyl-AMP cyclohydrolase